jgi:1-deoxy-D-xylulose-5-phosphate synthase
VLLENIKKPIDLKRLSLNELEALSYEIRQFLISSVSATGGHLASNLGVVELTIALHYCFKAPKDKIIWDVGHQSYVHKILTGRMDKFNTLRQFGGLSGFPKTNESKYDVFDVGHSSTSISLALGFAKARDLANEDDKVIAVIGDGSITSGIAFEALNNAGRSNTDMTVVLNDNDMAISRNVGGITKHLNDIRSAPSYIKVKKNINGLLNKVPVFGSKIGKGVEFVKDSFKYMLVPGVLFDELGFTYIGPIDGHNISELVKVTKQIKNLKGPVLLHVVTKKGKGYDFAEKNPEQFHGVPAFNADTGLVSTAKPWATYTDIFSRVLVDEAKKDKKILAITAAMPTGTGLGLFAEEFPDRFFDVGIAEAHSVTFAAALAKKGFTPVVAIYSTFLQRAYDSILHDVCLQNLHVVFAVDRAGIVGEDGETHQGVYDIAFLSTIPNMVILAPKNKFELEKMLKFAFNFDGPIAIRYPRGKASGVLEGHNADIEYAAPEIIFDGEGFAIISVGDMMGPCYEVYKKFTGAGHKPALVNARFIKPVGQGLVRYLNKFKKIFVVENHSSNGFFNNLLAEARNKEIISFAFPQKFIEHGSQSALFKKYGLDTESIYNSINNNIKRVD